MTSSRRRGHLRLAPLTTRERISASVPRRWTFADPSHFARTFKSRYGMMSSEAGGDARRHEICMKFAIDSDGFEAPRRRDAWRGILCDTYVGLDSDYADESFRSVIEGHAVGDYSLTRVTASSRYHVDRSRTLIKRDGCELVFFGSCLSGRFVMEQGGREAVVEPGVIAFNDATRPFRTHFAQGVDMVWLGVPKKAVADRVASFEDLTAIAFHPATPLQQIAYDFLSGLGAVLDRGVSDRDANLLVNQAVDLFAMMIAGASSSGPAEAVSTTLRITRLRRLKAYVDDHLHRTDLSALTAAAALAIPPSQITALLDVEGTTFDEYVLQRRLDGCHTFLTGATSLRVSLADVASLWGFADSDRLGVAFKTRFGVAPQDVVPKPSGPTHRGLPDA